MPHIFTVLSADPVAIKVESSEAAKQLTGKLKLQSQLLYKELDDLPVAIHRVPELKRVSVENFYGAIDQRDSDKLFILGKFDSKDAFFQLKGFCMLERECVFLEIQFPQFHLPVCSNCSPISEVQKVKKKIKIMLTV